MKQVKRFAALGMMLVLLWGGLAACGNGMSDTIKVDGVYFTMESYTTNLLLVPKYMPQDHSPVAVDFHYEEKDGDAPAAWGEFYRWMSFETPDGEKVKPVEYTHNPDYQKYTVWFSVPKGTPVSEMLVVYEGQKMPFTQ